MSGQPASRITDICSGHGCFPPRPITSCSGDFIIDNLGAARETDSLASHCCDGSCHSGSISSGSSTYYVNGLQQARITDPVDCGSTIAQGCNTFIVG